MELIILLLKRLVDSCFLFLLLFARFFLHVKYARTFVDIHVEVRQKRQEERGELYQVCYQKNIYLFCMKAWKQNCPMHC